MNANSPPLRYSTVLSFVPSLAIESRSVAQSLWNRLPLGGQQIHAGSTA